MKKDEQIRIAIAGGGTGGHLFPALNLGKAIKNTWNAQLLFFGTIRGIEKDVIPRAGEDIIFLPVRGFRRKITLENILTLYHLWRSIAISKKALRRFNPHLVLGTGGYVMGPVLKAAVKMGIPIVIQEQNSYPGLTTRMLAKKAEYIFLAYEEAKQYLPKQAKTIITGNPISLPPVKTGKREARKIFELHQNKLTILVLGGSQGAENINRAVMSIVRTTKDQKNVQWLWQTGKNNFIKWIGRVAAEKIKNVKVVPFIREMFKAYGAADLVVCRGGAMTLSELMAMGKPAVIVPNPYSPADHQYKNAQVLAKHGAALVVRDNANLTDNLQQTLNRLLAEQDKIQRMAKNMKSLYPGDSVAKILQKIAELLQQKGVSST